MKNLLEFSEMASLCLIALSWEARFDNFEKVLIVRVGVSCSIDMIDCYTPPFHWLQEYWKLLVHFLLMNMLSCQIHLVVHG